MGAQGAASGAPEHRELQGLGGHAPRITQTMNCATPDPRGVNVLLNLRWAHRRASDNNLYRAEGSLHAKMASLEPRRYSRIAAFPVAELRMMARQGIGARQIGDKKSP